MATVTQRTSRTPARPSVEGATGGFSLGRAPASRGRGGAPVTRYPAGTSLLVVVSRAGRLLGSGYRGTLGRSLVRGADLSRGAVRTTVRGVRDPDAILGLADRRGLACRIESMAGGRIQAGSRVEHLGIGGAVLAGLAPARVAADPDRHAGLLRGRVVLRALVPRADTGSAGVYRGVARLSIRAHGRARAGVRGSVQGTATVDVGEVI